MLDATAIKESGLVFREERTLGFLFSTQVWLANFLGLVPPCPVEFTATELNEIIKDKLFGFLYKFPAFIETVKDLYKIPPSTYLGEVIFDASADVDVIAFHKRRYNIWKVLTFVLGIPVAYLSFFLWFVILFVIWSLLFGAEALSSDSNQPIILGFFYLFLILSFSTSLRIVSFFVSRYFAESLAVTSILYLLIDLSRETVLSRPSTKRTIQHRINHLAKMTVLLASRYSSKNEKNQEWLARHFKELEYFIRERERWVMAPSPTTLADLRQDFLELAPIFISGDYGAFKWRNLTPEPEKVDQSWQQRFRTILSGFVAIVLPLALIVVYVWQPGVFSFLQSYTDILPLIFITWFIIAIDSYLKLGIVSGLTNLAKGIKDLA